MSPVRVSPPLNSRKVLVGAYVKLFECPHPLYWKALGFSGFFGVNFIFSNSFCSKLFFSAIWKTYKSRLSWRHNVTVRCCQDVEEARHEIHILIQMFSNFHFLWHWSQVLYFFLISSCDFLLFLLFVKYPDIWKLIFSHLEAYKLGLTDYICAISSLAFEMFRPHKKTQSLWPTRSKKIWQ